MRAVVDIGSNSLKFILGDYKRGALTVVDKGSWVPRLAHNMDKNGNRLEASSLLAAEKALAEIAARLAQAKDPPTSIQVVGTAAVRKAVNRSELEALVQKYLHAPLQVLSGKDEAYWSTRGARLAVQKFWGEVDCVFVDVGGASTEVGLGQPDKAYSFEAGALKCHEALGLNNMPVSDAIWAQALGRIQEFFPPEYFAVLGPVEALQNHRAVAVGGTLLQAAQLIPALRTEPEGRIVKLSLLEDLNERLRRMSFEERCALPGVERDRADILCAGILCLTHVLQILKKSEVLITVWGLRHGLMTAEQS